MRRTSISHLYTEREGPVLVLRAIDPYGDDVGWHPAKTDDGWAALGVRYGRYAPHFGGGFGKDIARGLRSAAIGGRSTMPTCGSSKFRVRVL